MTLEERFAKFNIKIKENNHFRPIYEILKDVSDIWYQLSEKEQTELGKAILGHYYNKSSFEKYYII